MNENKPTQLTLPEGEENMSQSPELDFEDEEDDREAGKLYQDELYGTKVLTPLAVAIIDTPEFQRLAGLRQLGFSDLVYRGAVHTRLSHSIGTYLLARTIMRRIVQNHERLWLPHPGSDLPECFRSYPWNAFPKKEEIVGTPTSSQSKWRGLMEAVSAAALVHDIGHVPFGHTLEDEFAGIYERHDSLAGPRLYELLLNKNSVLGDVFGDDRKPWISAGIKNSELAHLIYVTLSWKERIDPPASFDVVLAEESAKMARGERGDSKARKRLDSLQKWYQEFRSRGMFHPFMADIIGNTICADLLDYLPRDRMNLGMEWRRHDRLQRYMTIREGSLYPEEGKRVSIMVNRRGHGGQRRDVATAVLDIMRERYEMAERVYYHHKKAAASAMLAKLAEIAPSAKPNDSDDIYPAPWGVQGDSGTARNVAHFSDSSLIDHLGQSSSVKPEAKNLQRQLHVGLRYDRRAMYRTLMVIDTDLVHLSSRTNSYFAMDLREKDGRASNQGRLQLEAVLAKAAGTDDGQVLVYCPSINMQSKEVNARLEIIEGRVLPLSVQKESFAYHADVRVLQQYYEELWRMYVFVSPELYRNKNGCQAVVDCFCDRYGIDRIVAYSKVRGHDLKVNDVFAREAMEPLRKFIDGRSPEAAPFRDIPSAMTAGLFRRAANDNKYLDLIRMRKDPYRRITQLFDIAILESRLQDLAKAEQEKVSAHINQLEAGRASSRVRARGAFTKIEDYAQQLLDACLKPNDRP